jgi:hypothetical protein
MMELQIGSTYSRKDNMPRLFSKISLLMLTLASLSASAQEGQFGSWAVGSIVGNEGLYAATMNDSNALLGQYCYFEGENCVWLLANDLGCENGSKYPVLINTDAGATSMELECMKLGGKPRYAFTDFQSIDKSISETSNLGIAFPLQSGRFQVNRFSMNGAIKAITFMRNAGELAISKKKNSTKDIRL